MGQGQEVHARRLIQQSMSGVSDLCYHIQRITYIGRSFCYPLLHHRDDRTQTYICYF